MLPVLYGCEVQLLQYDASNATDWIVQTSARSRNDPLAGLRERLAKACEVRAARAKLAILTRQRDVSATRFCNSRAAASGRRASSQPDSHSTSFAVKT